MGMKATRRVEANYHSAGKPSFDSFSSKQDRALLDRFDKYWTAPPHDLRPTALRDFLYAYHLYRLDTDMAA